MAATNILLLDDDEANSLFFETILAQSDQDFNISKAKTAAEAEEAIVVEGITFVISAWDITPVPGSVFVQRLKRDSNKLHLPVVLYSKSMADEDLTLTKQMGLDKVLGMPFDRGSAVEMIEGMVQHEKELPESEQILRKIECQVLDGHYSEAIKDIGPPVLDHAEKSRAFAAIADAWLGVRNFGRSKVFLDRCLRADGEHAKALQILGRWHSLQGQHDEAIEVLTKARDLCPKNLTSLLALGRAQVAADRFEDAEASFNAVDELDGEFGDLKDERGIMAFLRNDMSLASKLLAETERATEIARLFNDFGIAKIGAQEFDASIELFTHAVKILGGKTKTHLIQYNLALAWFKKGESEKAFEGFCESYVMEPSFERAYAALAKLAKDLQDAGTKLNSVLVERVRNHRSEYKRVMS